LSDHVPAERKPPAGRPSRSHPRAGRAEATRGPAERKPPSPTSPPRHCAGR